jgi:3-methyladenine DNA glycosylase/8-oxoguanine DNA glycosylase
MAMSPNRPRTPESGEPLETVVRPRLPVTLALTIGPMLRIAGGRMGRAAKVDPDGSWWRASRTPQGPATARFLARREGVLVQAWGQGAAWMLEHAPDLLGGGDSLEGFEPPAGLVRELHRRMPGLRIGRSHAVFEAAVPAVLAQKVAGPEAGRAWSGLIRSFGKPAPGPAAGLRLPPAPGTLAELTYQAYHPFGVEMRRANTIRGLATRAAPLEAILAEPHPQARRTLMSFPGVGAWTAAEVALVALGDPDAVSVGDYHIPDTVSWALAGEPRGSDERMLELLEPFSGHRGRVIRLLEAAGISAPRYGPKAPVRSIHRL